VTNDDHCEDRLRALLRDPRWSLPAWPDADARIRRAAQRQRRATATLAAGACAVVIAVIVVPVTLLTGGGARPAIGTGASASASPGPSRPARHPLSLPPVGAPGFPASTYPAPRARPVVNSIGHCPAAVGLRPFPLSSGNVAYWLTRKLGHSFAGDLRLTDRAFWPAVRSGWQPGGSQIAAPARRPPIYSGLLGSYRSSAGPPDFTGLITAGCGARLARDTWMIVEGPRRSPALQSEWLFLDRRGHVLLYYNQ
jgi:hypothetical protein